MRITFCKMILITTLFSLKAFCQIKEAKETEQNNSVSIAKMVPLKEKVLRLNSKKH